MKKYELTIQTAFGSCDTELFKKMVKRGDITASKIDSVIDHIVRVTGYAIANIKTDDKEFNNIYFATDEGYFYTGSEYLLNSIKDYLDDTDTFKILKVKTKKGHTYKASPIVKESKNEE
ncbi:hypothetical protein J6W34_04720 [bacterium]|nr:hypothetical protein [bacterium]